MGCAWASERREEKEKVVQQCRQCSGNSAWSMCSTALCIVGTLGQYKAMGFFQRIRRDGAVQWSLFDRN